MQLKKLQSCLRGRSDPWASGLNGVLSELPVLTTSSVKNADTWLAIETVMMSVDTSERLMETPAERVRDDSDQRLRLARQTQSAALETLGRLFLAKEWDLGHIDVQIATARDAPVPRDPEDQQARAGRLACLVNERQRVLKDYCSCAVIYRVVSCIPATRTEPLTLSHRTRLRKLASAVGAEASKPGITTIQQALAPYVPEIQKLMLDVQ